MVPYPNEDHMNPKQARYNYLHSRTRIIVKRSIGILKNRFRILKLPLNQKKDSMNCRTQIHQMARVLESGFVLHNLLIEFADEASAASSQIPEENESSEPETQQCYRVSSEAGMIRDGIAQYLYENKDLLKASYG
jgi:hypothetical protein